ncbi:hypothetical protein NLJ89_g4502 [Agrocybe chaxingu]|uniref:Exosome complex protein n=1 Tax=Agrocybe chaxingu TaxID=84603 RepID=A0A9W8MWH1_9AGAR|nr:hypothetical protein NLJ89_g4502 [Agrocybe chaxingu]
MTSETAKIKSKLLALTSAFDDLESQLEPLFTQTLPETLVGLEPIQQAKLQTALPYVIYDLIFNPRTHPVIGELDRIKQYFDKIQNAENPPAKRADIDKDAAARFIKHAIAQSQWKKTAAEEAQECDANNASTSTSTSLKPAIPAKVTSKMLERKQYEEELKAQDEKDEEEDVLEVYEERDDAMNVDDERSPSKSTKSKSKERKGKEKEKVGQVGSLSAPAGESESSSKKRRRPAVDPFAGYGDTPATSNPATPDSDHNAAKKKKSKISKPSAEESKTTPKPDTEADPSLEKKSKKSKKKAKNLS